MHQPALLYSGVGSSIFRDLALDRTDHCVPLNRGKRLFINAGVILNRRSRIRD